LAARNRTRRTGHSAGQIGKKLNYFKIDLVLSDMNVHEEGLRWQLADAVLDAPRGTELFDFRQLVDDGAGWLLVDPARTEPHRVDDLLVASH
jgi:hypothetical protein